MASDDPKTNDDLMTNNDLTTSDDLTTNDDPTMRSRAQQDDGHSQAATMKGITQRRRAQPNDEGHNPSTKGTTH